MADITAGGDQIRLSKIKLPQKPKPNIQHSPKTYLVVLDENCFLRLSLCSRALVKSEQ